MHELLADPVAAMKWLAILAGFAGLYFQARRWESRMTGKLDRINIQSPLEVVPGQQVVTHEAFAPVLHRVGTLENEVRVIRLKMDADKQEILHSINAMQEKTQEGLRSIERAIGRLEGGSLK